MHSLLQKSRLLFGALFWRDLNGARSLRLVCLTLRGGVFLWHGRLLMIIIELVSLWLVYALRRLTRREVRERADIFILDLHVDDLVDYFAPLRWELLFLEASVIELNLAHFDLIGLDWLAGCIFVAQKGLIQRVVRTRSLHLHHQAFLLFL